MIFAQILFLASVVTRCEPLSLPFDLKNVLPGINKPQSPPKDWKDLDKIVLIASSGPTDFLKPLITCNTSNGCYYTDISLRKCKCPPKPVTFVDYPDELITPHTSTTHKYRHDKHEKQTNGPEETHHNINKSLHDNSSRTESITPEPSLTSTIRSHSQISERFDLQENITTKLHTSSATISSQSQVSEIKELGTPKMLSSSGRQVTLWLANQPLISAIFYFLYCIYAIRKIQ